MLVQPAKPASPIRVLHKQLSKVCALSADNIFTTLCAPVPNRISHFKDPALPQVYVFCSLLTQNPKGPCISCRGHISDIKLL